MFKTIWRKKYLLHELLSTNHNCHADTIAKINYLIPLKYFSELQFNYLSIDFVAEYGNLPVLIWLHNRGEECTTRAMDYAAMNGHLHVIRWLHENREEGCTQYAMSWAAERGNLEMVKWFHENRTEGCTTQAMNWAAMNGHLHVVKWLHENRTEGCTTKAMDWAAMNGHLPIVKFIHCNSNDIYEIDNINDVIKFAKRYGKGCEIECVKWLENRIIEK